MDQGAGARETEAHGSAGGNAPDADTFAVAAPSRAASQGVVAILGLGLIGGSLGMALRARGAAREVVGWNRSPEALPLAVELGAIDRAAATPEEAVAGADLVVLGVPVRPTIPLLARIVPALQPGAIVTDVGSTKARIAAQALDVLPDRFVGGHPMAGSEEAGVAAGSPKLFEGATWVLTPTDQTSAGAAERVERLAAGVGALPCRCDAALHDRLVASLSHLPHALAFGLAQTAADAVPPEWARLAAGSFRDGTRVARSRPELWAQIMLDNRAALVEALDRFDAWSQQLRRAIDEQDQAALVDLLTKAHEARERFPR